MASRGPSKRSTAHLRSVDYFRKVPRDLTEGSLSGGGISLMATVLMVFLVVGEIRKYRTTRTVTDVYVDQTSDGLLRVNFDVSFPEISCEHLSVNAKDVIGHKSSNVTANVRKLATTHGDVLSRGAENPDKKVGWVLVDHHSGPTAGHVLQQNEEAKLYHDMKSSKPELFSLFEGMTEFKNLDKDDQEVLKLGMALMSSWSEADIPDNAMNPYGGKAAAYEISDEKEFARLAGQYDVLLVDFHAPWCPHCRHLSPTFEKLAYFFNKALYAMYDVYHQQVPDYESAPAAEQRLPQGKVLIASVNCVANRNICFEHKISGYPTIRVYRKKNGKTKVDILQEYEVYKGPRGIEELIKFTVASASAAFPGKTNLVSVMVSAMEIEPVHDASKNKVVIPFAPEQHTEVHSHGGCRIQGSFLSSRVPGRIEFIAFDKDVSFDLASLNMTHEILLFSFGDVEIDKGVMQYLLKYNQGSPEQRDINVLWEHQRFFAQNKEMVSYHHYVRAVSTVLKWNKSPGNLQVYEFAVSSNEAVGTLSQDQRPAVVFDYDLSPIQVVIREERERLLDFIVSLCAIVGGIFTVASMVDSIVFRTSELVTKVNLGKQG